MHRQAQTLIAQVIILSSVVLFTTIFFHAPAKGSSSLPSAPAGTSMYGLSFTDYAGNEVHLYDFRRKPLVVYTWASWCPYCGAEMQHLAEVQSQYGDKIQIVAINRGEARATAKNFTDHLSVSDKLIILLDPADAYFKQIGGYAMPETLYINAAGETAAHTRGPSKPADVDSNLKNIAN